MKAGRARHDTPPEGSIEWFDDRFYKVAVGGETLYLPSVTTILGAYPKPFLAQWRGEVGNQEARRVMNEAAERGSRIHHACYTIAQGGCVLLSGSDDNADFVLGNQEEYLQAYRFVQWLDEVRPDIRGAEATLYTVEGGFAGTMDYLFAIDGGEYHINGSKPVCLEPGLYIADLKTGSQISDDYSLQLAAYRKMFEEGGERLAGAIIIHTNAKTRTAIEGLATVVRTAEELDGDYEDFRALHQVWRRTNATLKPRVFDMPGQLTWRK